MLNSKSFSHFSNPFDPDGQSRLCYFMNGDNVLVTIDNQVQLGLYSVCLQCVVYSDIVPGTATRA